MTSAHPDPAVDRPDVSGVGDASGVGMGVGLGELSELERCILDAAGGRWTDPAGGRETIREQFGISVTRYYQVLNALLDEPAALAYDPLVVKRLLRQRERDRRERSARRLAN
ncbi:DUF3263 domain-containing protein [Raineyella sp. W15-4]|uniref:DUF3263 domain-containing protein n=1 Tax=Raineyella sp. W15-4 TaxID=3081651 RepID=UPI002954E00D|nr:DUF3263 domain-containing protein [Raineyella sp. W15-4]WOQ16210.1 DUF3263 domain-containing protein [Raineyella sp. W15-4]